MGTNDPQKSQNFFGQNKTDWWVTRKLEKGCDYFFGIPILVSKSQEGGGWGRRFFAYGRLLE